MRSGKTSSRRHLIGCSLGPILAGCGGTPEIKPMPPDEQGLKQFAELYRSYARKKKRGPKSLKGLNAKGQGYPGAVEMLRSGELVVQWGAPLTPDGGAADAVLACVKTVPEQGGPVLMQDGRMIRTMTADEFAPVTAANTSSGSPRPGPRPRAPAGSRRRSGGWPRASRGTGSMPTANRTAGRAGTPTGAGRDSDGVGSFHERTSIRGRIVPLPL